MWQYFVNTTVMSGQDFQDGPFQWAQRFLRREMIGKPWATMGLQHTINTFLYVLWHTWHIKGYWNHENNNNSNSTILKNPKDSAGEARGMGLILAWIKKIPWGRKWQPTPVFLPGEFHGQRSLVGCSPYGCRESDPTEHTSKSNLALYCNLLMML